MEPGVPFIKKDKRGATTRACPYEKGISRKRKTL